MGFKDVLDWLRANDMRGLAIRVAELGVDDMEMLRNMDIHQFLEHGMDNLSIRPEVLVIHEHEPPTSRPDLPVVNTRGRGSMKRRSPKMTTSSSST